MKAKELLRRFNHGEVDIVNGGMLFNVCFDKLQDYVTSLFGKGSEILCGEMECGKDYIYLYAESEDYPNGFGEEDGNPVMLVSDGYNWTIWIYEIED